MSTLNAPSLDEVLAILNDVLETVSTVHSQLKSQAEPAPSVVVPSIPVSDNGLEVLSSVSELFKGIQDDLNAIAEQYKQK